MNPRSAAPLIAMRQAGMRPSCFVMLSFGNFPDPDWHRWADTAESPSLVIRPEDPVDRIDLRCLADLDLILFFAEWSGSVSRLYERLTEYAREIAVLSPAFETDIGWWWVKGVGRLEFDQRQHLTALEASKGEATAAALKNDAAGYASARAKERRAVEGLQWQR